MDRRLHLWVERLGLIVACLALPFYLGAVESELLDLVLYSALTGLVLAIVERVRFAGRGKEAAREFLADAGLRGSAVLGLGGPSYLIGLLLL